MTAVKSLCSSGIMLANGMLTIHDNIHNVVNKYLTVVSPISKKTFEFDSPISGNDLVRLNSIEFITENKEGRFLINEALKIKVSFTNISVSSPISVNLFFNTPDGTNIFATCSMSQEFAEGDIILKCLIPANVLNDNIYNIDVMIVANSTSILFVKETLIIEGIEPEREGWWLGKFPGLVRPMFEWQIVDQVI